MNEWIETQATFFVDGEEEEETWQDFCFRYSALDAYNKSSQGWATVRLKSGYEITIGMKFMEFHELIQKYQKDEIADRTG